MTARWTTQTKANALAAVAIVLYCVGLLICCKPGIMPGLDSDRFSFMECLVERGTFCVSGSSIVSVDWISIGGKFYSGKPPLMNFAGAGVYAIVHLLGWSFQQTPDVVVRVMMAIFVIAPLGWLLWMFWRCRQRTDLSLRPAAVTTLLLAIASLLLPYGLIFTNHVLAAALLFAAFVLAQPTDTCTTRRLFFAGLVAALSAAVDLLPGTFFIVGFLAASWRTLPRKGYLAFVAGAAIPTIAHFALNRLTLGVWTTSYFVKDAFNYPGSIFVGEQNPDTDKFPTYLSGLYHYTFGHRSLVMFMPLLIIGLVQATRAGLRRDSSRSPVAWAVVTATVATWLLVPKFSMGLAGSTYGPRHMIPAVALLYAYLPTGFLPPRAFAKRIGFWLLAVWSCAIACIGTLNPWSDYAMSVYAPLDVLAQLSARQGNTAFAEAIVMSTAPEAAHGITTIGVAHWKQKRYEIALNEFLKALKLEPNRGEAIYGAALVAYDTDRLPLALQMFERLTQHTPNHSMAWGYLAKTKARMGDRKGAEAAIRKALEIDPYNGAAFAARDMLAEQH